MSAVSTSARHVLPRRSVTLESPTVRGHALRAAVDLAARLQPLLGDRGYWEVCRRLGCYFGDHEFGHVRLADDAVFRIRLSDPYWLRLVGQSYRYEPEISALLARLKTLDYSFIDCGANHGYWSILATSKIFGCTSAVAVEPFDDSFRMLIINNRLNGSRFATLQRAVGEVSGENVVIRYRGNHAEVSIVADCAALEDLLFRDETVPTISLDDVFDEHIQERAKPLIVKLDVEGNEISAFAGARRILSYDALVIYEDHGSDPQCTVTRFVFEELNMAVLHINDGGQIAEMHSVKDVHDVKRSKSRGYNFVCLKHNSQFMKFLEY